MKHRRATPTRRVIPQVLRRLVSGGLLAGVLAGHGQVQPVGDAEAGLRARAYELYDEKKYGEAAEQFRVYLQRNQRDIRVQFDYASLLLQLNRQEEAARVLEQLHQLQPRHDAGYFRLGVTYVTLGRTADADRVFQELQQSANPAMATAAGEARRRLGEEEARAARAKAEGRVFELARGGDHAGVVVAISELEKTQELSFPLQMQRLYALAAMRRFAEALPRAEQLAQSQGQAEALDLAMVRADLLAELDRRPEAETVWHGVVEGHPGTAATLEASRRLEERTLPPLEDHVYELVRQKRHREALAAIDDLQRAGPLAWPMEVQRVYSLEALGETAAASRRAEELAAKNPEATDLALLRADLLIRQRAWFRAARVLKEAKARDPGSDPARAAGERLHGLPPVANLDKWFWGEAYASGDYLGRYGTVVGSGFLRQGAFLPEARWLQPYAEHLFGVDTGSRVSRGHGPGQTILFDNAVGFYGGMRLQFLPREYLFLYGQGGVNKDLLGQRENGDWALDYQAGLYGSKSWGPGTVFQKGATPVPADATPADGWFWRGDWFVDAGGNFSYYHRYTSWIGYGQVHEGLRLAQWGADVAFDGYLVENVTWDVRGNFFDNFTELGPGARAIWHPHPNWQVVLNCEWLQGFYFGRDDRHNRNGAPGDYNGVHVGLSVGATW